MFPLKSYLKKNADRHHTHKVSIITSLSSKLTKEKNE